MNWQERLNQFEESAPQDGWNNLQEALELDQSGLREKLLAMEFEPPATSWNNIRESLISSQPKSARIIPFFRRHAATAGIAASLLLVIYIYLGSGGDITPGSVGLSTGMGKNLHQKPSEKTGKIDPGQSTQAELPPATDPEIDHHNSVGIEHFKAAFATAGKSAPRPGHQKNISTGENYIELCDEKGACDRLTYKLEDWASCMHASCIGNDAVATEKARKIKAWRVRLEQSTYVPAAGHFFDIGEMAAILQTAER